MNKDCVLLLSAIVFSIMLTACTTLTPNKPLGTSRLEYLSDNSEMSLTSNAKTMKENLFRSERRFPSSSSLLYIEAVPRTVPYLRTKLREAVLEQSYKEKWDNEQEVAELKKTDVSAIELAHLTTCFDFHAISDNTHDAQDQKTWHATLISGGKEIIPGFFHKFDGFHKDTITTSYSQFSANSYITKRTYYLYGTLCFMRKIDYSQKFALKIEPRFARDIDPVVLEWLPPESSEKSVAINSDQVREKKKL